ncbi:MAG: protein-disulfide reductase DsbD family protein, partial [Oceanospirillum sp.]|nr:protein-disulfide reductase DsbD family protein [Oceanospirillum sp.]
MNTLVTSSSINLSAQNLSPAASVPSSAAPTSAVPVKASAPLVVTLLSCLLLLASLFSLPVFAAESDWAETPQAKARLLVAALEEEGDQKILKAGLEIQMDDGWKTYWRTPGAAGIPPVVKATSGNIDSIQLHYPAPLRLDFQGLQLYGYEKKVIFPLDIALKPTADNSNLALDARILICRELCIPVSFKPEIPAADLPDLNQAASGVLDADAAFRINQYVSRIPRSAEQAELEQATIQLDSQQKLLEIQLRLPANMQLLDLFPELSPEPELDAPVIGTPTAIENSSIQSTSIQNNSDQLWRAQFPIQRKRMPSADEAANLVIRTSQGDFELPLNWQSADTSLTPLQGTPVSGHQ